jgi:hypothetical protein
MLESLEPNLSLQELKVRGYKGIRFPHWLSELSNLVSIHLIFCPRLKHIPPLDKIPSLREMLIMHLNNLEYMDSEGDGGRGVSGFSPSLKKLSIYNCPNLKGWWKKSRDEKSDDNDESLKEMLCFPCLSSLSIVDCPNLTSIPFFQTLSILFLLRASSIPLQQTMEMTSPVSSSSSSRPLSKLKKLYIYFIDDMESLPEVGLQNLSSLQQLSIRGCSRLKSLPLPDQGMPSLQKLNISSCKELGYLSQSESQRIPYLTSLQELEISYCSGELRVIEYGGTRFPSWLSHLSNLVRVHLQNCRRLERLPPLDGIPSLEELSITNMASLEYIDSEGVGGKGVSTFFQSLKELRIFDCPRLKGWWKKSRDEMNDDNDEPIKETLCFPRLSSLSIDDCPNLTSMPLFPNLDEGLYLWKTSSMPLQQTMEMTSPVSSSSSFIRPLSKLKNLEIYIIDDMESLPEVGLQNLSSLQQLLIYGCGRLKSLPLPDQGMPSLQTLRISYCRKLKSLSESKYQGRIPHLPSLQFLRINGCSGELTRGRGKESVEEWPPNIKHIQKGRLHI